jgi:hypothetical protein
VSETVSPQLAYLVPDTFVSHPGTSYSFSYNAASLLLYWLIAHLILTVLMIVRRTHVLLSAEFSQK